MKHVFMAAGVHAGRSSGKTMNVMVSLVVVRVTDVHKQGYQKQHVAVGGRT
jgi:hypothetical protein